MPSTSKKQHNFMAAVANNPSFAKKAGVPQSVGKEFNEADKGRKFSKGGDMKKMNMGGYADGGMTMVKKGDKMVPDFAADGKGKMAKGGMAGMHKMPDGKMMKDSAMKKMAHGGMAKSKMASGGIASSLKSHASAPASKAHAGMKSGGMTKFSAGGSASKRADGVATKGKTKGTMVKMTKGGMAC